MRTIAFSRNGQTKTVDNVRNQTWCAFKEGCPANCPIRPSAGARGSELVNAAINVYGEGRHKTSLDYLAAWKNSCFQAVAEAHSTAQTCSANVRKGCPEAVLPTIPPAPVANGNIDTFELDLSP